MPSSDPKETPSNEEGNGCGWWYRVGFVVSLVCLFYFGHRALAFRASIAFLTEEGVARLALAVILCLLSCFAAAWAWRYVLKLLGVHLSLSVAASIFLTTQFGKYLPGNVAHHIGRITLAKRYGIPLRPVLISMIADVGVGVGVMLSFSIPVIVTYVQLESIWLLVAGVAAALIGAAIWYRRENLQIASKAVMARLNSTSKLKWVVPILISVAGALLNGSALLLLDAGLTERFETIAYVISVFCAAWVAGFVTPGAPAGLGIREVILGGGLAPIIGIERATAAAILLRAASTLADILTFGVGVVLLHHARSAHAKHLGQLDRLTSAVDTQCRS